MLSGTGQIYGRSRLRLVENAMFKIWNDMFMLGIEAQQVAFLRAMKSPPAASPASARRGS